MARVTLQVPAAGAGQPPERRKAERAELVVRIDYSTVDELFAEFTRDINEGGVFIETSDPRAPGTAVTLHFSLPGDEPPVAAAGKVVWTTDGSDGGPAGMGIEFENLSADARARIDKHVRKLRAGR